MFLFHHVNFFVFTDNDFISERLAGSLENKAVLSNLYRAGFV